MFAKLIPGALIVCVGAAMPLSGCSSDGDSYSSGYEEPQTNSGRSYSYEKEYSTTQRVSSENLRDWPANAVPGECYAKAYVPPTMQTVKQQVLKREATVRTEIVPARYEWVEERVMSKEPSCTLTEVPAEFKTEQYTVEVRPAETTWLMNNGNCRTADGKTVNNVYCLVTRPAETKTVSRQVMCKPARVERVEVPAEYQTVRRQKLVAAATTKKVCIPAEYETVEKSVVSAPARWEWQRVICDHEPITMNAVKRSLVAHGYKAGPMNGEMTEQDWQSVRAFQLANGLGVGNLSHETLNKLQVAFTK